MRSLGLKLILSFLAISLIGTVLVAVLAGRATASEFGHYTARNNQAAIMAELVAYYREHSSWEGVATAVSFRGNTGSGHGQGGQGSGGGVALADAAGIIVMGGIGYPVNYQLTPAELEQSIPVEVNGQPVGALLIGGGESGGNEGQAEAEFLDRVNRAFLWAAATATAVALSLAILLTRNLTRPLRELTSATRAIAKGDLTQTVNVRSQDELGELATSFNQMSADLANARNVRRQMTADIAHDLRTPISVILGHAEALEDGVLPPTPENIDIIHDEARRLNRLVTDLRILSLAEAGELPLTKRPSNLIALLERTVLAYAPQAQQRGVTLQLDCETDLPDINIDPDRIAQVIGNLVNNALRHTPADGTITLCAQQANNHTHLQVRDTGAGIAAADLPHVFDRFYRADKSRQRSKDGSSGLGLAIAKSIIEGHNGRIWVKSELDKGTTFFIDLP